ncbi:MAG: YcxB family protein [Clostridia bacterium]|nr:YcxB family protein [Clostridia bacterium]MBR6687180.1 YcxB family protein [Clostridia bacterium]
MIIFENTFDQNVAKSATKQAFKKAIWIYVVFAAVFLILGLMMLLVNPRLAIFYIVMGVLILPIGYVLTNAIQSKTNKTMSVMSAETKEVFEFDYDFVKITQTKGDNFKAVTQTDFSYFYKVFETKTQYFLYISNMQVHVVNKSGITQGTIEEFNEILSSSLGSKFKPCRK